MSWHSLDALLDECRDRSTASPRGAELERSLRASRRGRWLLEVHRGLQASEETDVPANLTNRIMDRLPGGSPALYRQIGDVVVRAWADPVLREALRRDALAALAREGIELAAGTVVEVVTVAEAELPTAERLVLPLPTAGSPAVAPADARRRLAETEFGWLWGMPQAAPEAALGEAAAGLVALWHTGVDRWRRAMTVPLVRRQLAFAAVVGAAGLAVVILVADRGMPGGYGLTGQSGASSQMQLATLVGVIGLALLAYLAWRDRG